MDLDGDDLPVDAEQRGADDRGEHGGSFLQARGRTARADGRPDDRGLDGARRLWRGCDSDFPTHSVPRRARTRQVTVLPSTALRAVASVGRVHHRGRAVRSSSVILAAGLTLGLAVSPALAAAAPTFRLTSTAFADGDALPAKFSCQGEGVSPRLAWKGVPKGTKALALILDDPDAPAGTFVHWVLADFKPKPRSIPQGGEPKNVFGGLNGTGRPGYLPPCPPPGPAHRYVFTLYALKKPAKLPPGATATTLRDAIAGTTLAEAQLVGLYARS